MRCEVGGRLLCELLGRDQGDRLTDRAKYRDSITPVVSFFSGLSCRLRLGLTSPKNCRLVIDASPILTSITGLTCPMICQQTTANHLLWRFNGA